jgi:glucosyl-3-phosphoglycerate synthase
VLPEFSGGGKGDALWKSLFVSRGDIVVWVDSDIRNFHPRFVYALVGPLLRDPAVQYVKGFYDRPIADDARLRPTGGGRVTELVARPLINMFWPDLAWIIQPLSGEYAGRRALLERIPFATGYGVELAMLVDVAEATGVESIAQVDLETRVHRNQSIRSLSRMSFGILQAAIGRLERQGRLKLQAEPRTTMLQFLRRRDEYEAREAEVRIEERPPMIEVPGYRNRR